MKDVVKFFKILWHGMFIAYHLKIGRRVDVRTPEGRKEADERFEMANRSYKKAFGTEYSNKKE
jgi:hypothetical protein